MVKDKNKLIRIINYDVFSPVTQAYSEKRNQSFSKRSRTFDLPITSSDAPPLSYRRLLKTKLSKSRL